MMGSGSDWPELLPDKIGKEDIIALCGTVSSGHKIGGDLHVLDQVYGSEFGTCCPRGSLGYQYVK